MKQYTSEEAMAERRRAYLREKRSRKAAEQHNELNGGSGVALSPAPTSNSLDGDATQVSSGQQTAPVSSARGVPDQPPPLTLVSSSSDANAAAAASTPRDGVGLSYLWKKHKPAQRVV